MPNHPAWAIALVLTAVTCLAARGLGAERAYPCTMYKPADIARAKANIARHPWAQKLYARIKSWTKRYDGMDRDRLRAFVPDKTPLVTVKCPKCGNGPWYAYSLVNNGDALQCKSCKSRFDFDPNDTSETWNIHGVLRSYRLHHVMNNVEYLGLVYQLDGDMDCAAKAAAIVERFAEVFKGYRTNRVNQNVWCGNHPYYGKIDGWKRRDAHTVRQAMLAYDLIHDSGALTPAQCAAIDRDLVAHARDYFLEGYGGKGYLSHSSIQDQGDTWWCLAGCGALLADKELLRSVVAMYEEMLHPGRGIFYQDGTFFEGTANYQSQLFWAIAGIPEIVRGNLDVDIYSNPKCALLRKCYTWVLDALWPDGTIIATNDAHVGTRVPLFWSETAFVNYRDPEAIRHLRSAWGPDLAQGTVYSLFYRDPETAAAAKDEPYSTGSTHLTGAGMMILRHGTDKANQTVAVIDYGPLAPQVHKHVDYLNFGLWAHGMEMVTEMGYSRCWVVPALKWQRSARAHNTVLEVAAQMAKGKPVAWCITPGPKLAEAGALPGNSRFVALLPLAAGAPVIVDIFRVSGNEPRFHWVMHARGPITDTAGLEGLAAAQVVPPLRAGRTGRCDGPAAVTWRMAGKRPRGLRVLLPQPGASTVTVSECPPEQDAIDATHVPGGNLKPGAVVPYRGHLTVSRPGPSAVFVAVHVPFEGQTPPSVHVVQHAVADRPNAVALEIRAGDERYLVVHAPGPGQARWGDIQLEGRAAVAEFRRGRLESLCLAAGTRAVCGATRVERDTVGSGYVRGSGPR